MVQPHHVVDAATGVLMERYAQGADAAMAMLVEWSQTVSIEVPDVAAWVLSSVLIPHHPADEDIPVRCGASGSRATRHGRCLCGEAGAPGTDPLTLRRAVAFIDTHAARPIGVDDIAVAAGIGVRGLQQVFRRHRNSSPTAYLQRVRLERARRDLRAADATRGGSVAVVAARWQFPHPGRFSVAYRKRYGVSPSHTLRYESDPPDASDPTR